MGNTTTFSSLLHTLFFWPSAYPASRCSAGFAAHPVICFFTLPCICTHHALCREPVDICWERGVVVLGEGRKCQGFNRLAVADTGVDHNWLESVDKNPYPSVPTSVTMKAPRKLRTVPTASSANGTSLLPQGRPFPLL